MFSLNRKTSVPNSNFPPLIVVTIYFFFKTKFIIKTLKGIYIKVVNFVSIVISVYPLEQNLLIPVNSNMSIEGVYIYYEIKILNSSSLNVIPYQILNSKPNNAHYEHHYYITKKLY